MNLELTHSFTADSEDFFLLYRFLKMYLFMYSHINEPKHPKMSLKPDLSVLGYGTNII